MFAMHALSLNCGIRTTRPEMFRDPDPGTNVLTAIWPSYSFPWVPPKHRMPLGLAPRRPLITVSGRREYPHAPSRWNAT